MRIENAQVVARLRLRIRADLRLKGAAEWMRCGANMPVFTVCDGDAYAFRNGRVSFFHEIRQNGGRPGFGRQIPVSPKPMSRDVN